MKIEDIELNITFNFDDDLVALSHDTFEHDCPKIKLLDFETNNSGETIFELNDFNEIKEAIEIFEKAFVKLKELKETYNVNK